VPHHQANQPLFAQALANYHNSQQNSQQNANGTNFRQHFHHPSHLSTSSGGGGYHQRQLQFQKQTGPSNNNGRSLALENPASHHHQLHQLHQYQNHERQQQRLLLQQRLLINSSNSSGGGVQQASGPISNIHPGLPDHHHYGLPLQSSSNSKNISNGNGSLLEAQLLQQQQRNNSVALTSSNQHFKQGNPVWHLLTENKDLDQVNFLCKNYFTPI